MKQFRLLRAIADLRTITPEEVEASEPLVEFLVGWLRAEQDVGPLESLDALEIAAVVEAGRRLEAERAITLATALQGPWGRAAVASEIDGGQELDEMVVIASCNTLAERVRETLGSYSAGS